MIRACACPSMIDKRHKCSGEMIYIPSINAYMCQSCSAIFDLDESEYEHRERIINTGHKVAKGKIKKNRSMMRPLSSRETKAFQQWKKENK